MISIFLYSSTVDIKNLNSIKEHWETFRLTLFQLSLHVSRLIKNIKERMFTTTSEQMESMSEFIFFMLFLFIYVVFLIFLLLLS